MLCSSLGSILERYDITNVDYLSLDVEGSEFDVIAGAGLDTIRIDIINMEVDALEIRRAINVNNRTRGRLAADELRKHGYHFATGTLLRYGYHPFPLRNPSKL
ncbi:hypothetical protein AAMO2058_001706400 [Amorphochlora amoebiformis]